MKKALTVFSFLFSLAISAQDSLAVQSTDSLELAAMESIQENISDSIPPKKIIPGIYFDYGKLFTLPSNFETKYEGAFELIIKDKWQIITEIGYADLTPRSAIENGSYNSKGSYYKFGFGFVPHREPASRMGIGIRYGVSSFEDLGNYTIQSPSELQPDIEKIFDRRNLSATWWEAVFYSDKTMNKWLTVGFQFRVRFIQSYDSFEEVDVIAIPGYGRPQSSAVPALNLFLKFSPF